MRHSNAIIKDVFVDMKPNMVKELNKSLPENTIGEKIRKVRKMNDLECSEFCKIIKCMKKTLWLWEFDRILPHPNSIKKICDNFNIELEYFDYYYKWYFSDYEIAFLKWKN
ncbi:helix-turn-helix transcriptional regulator [Clostridium botulinum]|nr:helix-turn-helix transcriptional regulator [Clostridium botulinum]